MSSLSKIIAGVLLAAGLVLAFVAWRLASAPSSPPQPVTPVAASAPAPQEPVKFYPVVVAAKAIPAGTRIAPDMLEVAKWQVALSGGFPAATCSPARSCAPTSPWAIPSCRPCWRMAWPACCSRANARWRWRWMK